MFMPTCCFLLWGVYCQACLTMFQPHWGLRR